MLDPAIIIEQSDLIRETARKKGLSFDLDRFIELDTKRRKLQVEADKLRSQKNEANGKIAKMEGEERQAVIAEMKLVADQEKTLSEDLREVEKEWKILLLQAPGLMSDKTPEGKDDGDNVELYTWGKPRSFEFEAKDHVQLGLDLDIIDIERGVKIAGSRNYFLKGDGALLELAILNYTLQKLVAKGFTAFLPPMLVKHEAMLGTGYFPGGEDQAYALGVQRPGEAIESDDKYLIGTSEVSVASYHKNETLSEEELPKLYAGYSYCFRREAGTYGKDTHGLYRIHQFQKVEQVVLCKNDKEESAKMHEFLLKNAEEVLQDLALPYRVVAVCSGDMGQGQYYKNDIETWMPSRGSYGETHSCSTFLDFQARRLNIKYKDANGDKRFVHTLNNTCIASPRILIPLLEQYQNKDGSITIPEVLQPYMGGKSKITKTI